MCLVLMGGLAGHRLQMAVRAREALNTEDRPRRMGARHNDALFIPLIRCTFIANSSSYKNIIIFCHPKMLRRNKRMAENLIQNFPTNQPTIQYPSMYQHQSHIYRYLNMKWDGPLIASNILQCLKWPFLDLDSFSFPGNKKSFTERKTKIPKKWPRLTSTELTDEVLNGLVLK